MDFKHVRDQSEPQCHVPCSCTQHIQRHSFMQSTDEEKPTAEKETLLNCLIRSLSAPLCYKRCAQSFQLPVVCRSAAKKLTKSSALTHPPLCPPLLSQPIRRKLELSQGPHKTPRLSIQLQQPNRS